MTDSLTVYLSGDAYDGNAEAVVDVNGVQVSSVLDVSAVNSSDDVEAFTFTGDFGTAPQVSVSMVNDVYGEYVPEQERNLYVNGFSYDGVEQLGFKASEYYCETVTDTLTSVASTAERAEDFVNAAGVDVHLDYTDTSYGNVQIVEAALSYLGVAHIRVDLPTAETLPEMETLAAMGVKFDVLLPSSSSDASLPAQLATLDPIAADVTSIEGPNEANLTTSFSWDGQSGNAAEAAYQEAIWNDVHADPDLSSIPVYGLTLGGVGSSAYQALGTLSPYESDGNVHVYFNGAPESEIQYNLGLSAISSPGLPAVITETNYPTAPAIGGVTDAVQESYDLDALMDATKAGVAATYFYELLDENPDPDQTNIQNDFGLFNADGTPKPVATAIHDLTTILADPGQDATTFQTGSLAYTVTGLPASGDTLVLEKSSGVYDLVLWAEPVIWDASTETQITAQPRQVAVSLADPAAIVEVFDPEVGTQPIAVYGNAGSVQITVTDHPLIIQVAPEPMNDGAAIGGTSSVVVLSGAAVISTADQTLSGANIGSDESEYVYQGGTAENSLLQGWAVQFVASGALADAIFLHSGFEVVSSGGVTTATTVGSFGDEIVAGGTAVATTITSGGFLLVDSGGSATAALVESDAAEFVQSGGETSGATVDNAGFEILASGGFASNTMVSSGGYQALSAGGTAAGTVVSSGGFQWISSGGTAIDTIVSSGGEEAVFSGGVAIGTMVNDGGLLLVAAGALISGVVVGSGGVESFALASGTAEIPQTEHATGLTDLNELSLAATDDAASGTVLDPGAAIDVAYLTFVSGGSATVDPVTDLMTVVEGAAIFTQQLAGDYTHDFFHATQDSDGGTRVTVEGTPCYCRGTRILTESGEVTVETLAIGDRLVTHTGAVRPIRWIGKRSYAGRFAAGNRDVLPVRIDAGALGDTLPLRDLFVSPLHAMFIDGMLVPAGALVNGTSIHQVADPEQIDYFHIELESHDIIFAEGAPSETFLDDGSRGMFHNAAEYRRLYPAARQDPALYCAPRVESGHELERIRRRLAGRQHPAAAAGHGRLVGVLDRVDRDRVSGWASDDAAPDEPVWLRILDNGVALGEIRADCFREDLKLAGIGRGCHSFDFQVPGGLSPLHGHVIEVQRVADRQSLSGSPWTLACATTLPQVMAASTYRQGSGGAVCRGNLDMATRHRIRGWAWDSSDPQTPVAIVVSDNDVPIAHVLANCHRADLEQAGIENGRHAFDVTIAGGLSPCERHVIRATRERDGAELPGSPFVIDAVSSFDATLEKAVTRAVDALADTAEQDRALAFLLAQTERLRQQRADTEGSRAARFAYQQYRRRWGPGGTSPQAVGQPAPRALVIDETMPVVDRDAALLSHMRGLQTDGYAVTFVAADEMMLPAPALAAAGVACCGAPYYSSVEDVLRRQAGCFDVVYLCRETVAGRYLGLAQRYAPKAQIFSTRQEESISFLKKRNKKLSAQ